MIRRLAALVSILLVFVGTARSDDAGSGLHGRLVGTDGRSAAGYRVRLLDPGGRASECRTSADGRYRFEGLTAGPHGIAIVDPTGAESPMQVAELRLPDGTMTRADFKLLESRRPEDAGPRGTVAGSWWGGLTTPAKVWTALVIVSAGVLVAAGLDDDEEPATPF